MTDSPENDVPPTGVLSAGAIVGGRYRVQQLLGRGGMGIVYGATHELTRRKVAIKVVEGGAELPGHHERFLSEAQTAAAVRHPNIVDILDMGIHRGAPYLVMEQLEGLSLESVLRDGHPISCEQSLAWLLPIVGALATLHDAGIIHRDIKPSNIFLSRVHHAVVPKLLDFGLARLVSDARMTRSGLVIGTPSYMAPEHAAGATVGPLADVWSMGIVLYECIAGTLPYTSTDRAVVAAQVLAGHVRPLRQVRPDVPPALASAIEGALQRDLGLRHSSMRALARALVAAAGASGVGVPEQADPVGLPEYQSWRGHAPVAPALPAELSPTHELPIASAPANSNGTHRRRWISLVVGFLALAALGYWLMRANPAAAPGAEPAAPRASHKPDAGPVIAPVVEAIANDAPEAGVPTPAQNERTSPPPRAEEAKPTRRKKKARTVQAPAEVETEWK